MPVLTTPPTYVRDVADGLNRAPGAVNGLATTGADGILTAAQRPTSVAIAQGLRETAGPTNLTMGAVADGQYLTRSGTTIVGAAGGGITGSLGAVDNALVRTDGTGGSTVQAGSGVTVSDAGVMAGGTWQGNPVARAYGGYQPVSSASAPTVNDDSGDGYAVGQTWIETTNKVPYVLADATAGAAVWRPVLSAVRLRMYVASGVVYSVLEGEAGQTSTWVTIKGPTVVSKTAGTAALGTSASGSGFLLPAGYATAADQPSEGDVYLQPLDGSGGLGVTWTPETDGQGRLTVDHDQPAGNSYAVMGYFGRAAGTAPGIRVGYGRNGTGTAQVIAEVSDVANATTSCTRSAACTAMMLWCGTTARGAYAAGRSTSAANVVTLSALSTALTSTLYFGFVLTRTALAGGDITVSSASVIFTPGAGTLSWT